MQPMKFRTKINVMEITRHKTRGRCDRKCRIERLRIVFETISMIKDIEIEPLEKKVYKFYIGRSVHHNSRLKKSSEMQQYADIYLLLNYSTCFGRPSRPSSGVHKTVVAASGTDHNIWEASFFKRPYLVTFEEASFPDSIRGCNYSFMHS